MQDSTLGKRVARRRKLKKMSIQGLADAAGVHPNTIHNIEAGKTSVTKATLDSVAAALGTTSASLLAEPRKAASSVGAR